MCTVLEDIEQRHCSGGEAMYEKSFELAFSKVYADEDEGQSL